MKTAIILNDLKHFFPKVNETDIALSFLDGENPLPESDQSYATAAQSYFSRARSSSVSEGPEFEKNGQHPLRVLSEDCLVVSTFTGRKYTQFYVG